jgi:hypothetical protein
VWINKKHFKTASGNPDWKNKKKEKRINFINCFANSLFGGKNV